MKRRFQTPELHFSVPQLCAMFGRSERTMRDAIKAGEFGHEVIEVGGEFLVPSAGVTQYRTAHAVFDHDGALKPKLVTAPDRAAGRFCRPNVQTEAQAA